MHWIERHILKQLAYSDSLRYKDLVPDSVDGNLFQYHARVLEKRGLIDRNSDGYTLTARGKMFVADLSQTKQMNPRKLPRPMVMIINRNDEGEYLLFKWRRQPYRGLVGFPFGRQLYGTSLQDSAADQLAYKAGYQASLEFIGQVNSVVRDGGRVTEHLAISVFEAKDLHKASSPDGLTGRMFWGGVAEVSPQEVVAGFVHITAWYESRNRSILLDLSGAGS
jgi:8-oxo-dGTP pyrophosphatase MutT (NUDIX family)